jgi:hypothetical protein
LIHLLTFLVGLYLALCLLVYLVQDRLLFVRGGGVPQQDPGSIGLPFEELWMKTEDGVRLHGWWIPADETVEDPPAVVFCHGNAGHIEHRLGAVRLLHSLDVGVLLFDYRGYGASDGSPGEEGLYLDAVAAFDAVNAAGVPAARILAYGESLGGAVAIELCRRRPVAGWITEATFTSVPDMARAAYPWLPARLLCRHRFASIDKVAALTQPKLLIHSPDDHLVPFALARRLYAAAAEPKEFLATEGGHNDGGFGRHRRWIAVVDQFIRDVAEGTYGGR